MPRKKATATPVIAKDQKIIEKLKEENEILKATLHINERVINGKNDTIRGLEFDHKQYRSLMQNRIENYEILLGQTREQLAWFKETIRMITVPSGRHIESAGDTLLSNTFDVERPRGRFE